MIYPIGTQKPSVYQIPAWVPMFLGRHVRLVSPAHDVPEDIPVGSIGILDAIQWDYSTGDIFLVCAFGLDLSSLTNVPIHHVEPA